MTVIDQVRARVSSNRLLKEQQKGKLHWFPMRAERQSPVAAEMVYGMSYVRRNMPYMRVIGRWNNIYHFEEQELLLQEQIQYSTPSRSKVKAIIQEYLSNIPADHLIEMKEDDSNDQSKT